MGYCQVLRQQANPSQAQDCGVNPNDLHASVKAIKWGFALEYYREKGVVSRMKQRTFGMAGTGCHRGAILGFMMMTKSQ